MNRIAIALAGLVFLTLWYNDVSATDLTASRRLGHAKPRHFAGRLSTSGDFHGFHGHGLPKNVRGRHIHPHHFGDHKHFRHNKLFVPRQHLRHHVFPRHRRFHPGFFFGHSVIGVAPSSAVIWSNPGVLRGFAEPSTESGINEDTPSERPLISIMLRHRHELGLSPQQIHDLDELRDGYQRKAIRYDADLRITEMDVQRLLTADPMDLQQVRAKLQDMERLKVELRLARLGAIEEGKAALSPGQREKLSALLGDVAP
jgi:hypothetical protein